MLNLIDRVLSKKQVSEIIEVVNEDVPSIISVFAGRVADTGIDPVPHMIKCKEILRSKKKAERSKKLRILSNKLQHSFFQKYLNTEQTVLLEENNHKGMLYGFTDNYIKVKIPFKKEICKTKKQSRCCMCNSWTWSNQRTSWFSRSICRLIANCNFVWSGRL